MKTLDFYFDFISPYGYFASRQVEALAARHARRVRWHAFHMRAVTRDVLGMDKPLVDVPLKGDYVRKDVRRMARYLDLPYAPAPAAGFSSVNAGRVLQLLAENAPAAVAPYVHAVFRNHHVRADSPGTWAQCLALAAEAGADVASLSSPEAEAQGRALYTQATEAAVTRGVWGTPSFIVDEEMFWGCDRLPQLDDWLRRGGY